jgi:integrase
MKTDNFRLFKRQDERDAPYYFAFEYKRRRFTRCLETNNISEAQRRARLRFKEIVGALQQEDYPTLERLKLRATTTATVGQVITAYRTSPVDASADSRVQNIAAFRRLLRVVYGLVNDPAVDALRLTHISAGAASKWFELASARSLEADDQAGQASVKRSANSDFAKAASLFTARALQSYRSAGCYHNTLEAFAHAGKLHRFTRLPKTEYNAPPDTIIAATLAAWETLPNRNAFLAIGHELAFGLRANEMAQARWSWWNTREGYPVLDGRAQVKNGSNLIQVRALDPWYSIMSDRISLRGWRSAPDDFILEGSPSQREDVIFRVVSAWMRDLKWETRKTNHALRAYAGSQIAMKYGIYEAQCWLRHSTVKVTEAHYSHFVRRFRPADISSMPAHWASSAQEAPQLHIVQSQ